MGARVVDGGDIVLAGLLALVVGCGTGGRCCPMVGVAADVGMADVGTVAADPGTGAPVVVGVTVSTAVDAGEDAGVASVGITVCCAGWAGCSSATAVAVAAAIVASTMPARTIRFDHRFWSSGCGSAWGSASSPSPADSTTSSGSNK